MIEGVILGASLELSKTAARACPLGGAEKRKEGAGAEKGVVPFFDSLVSERRDPQSLERRFRLGLFKDLPEDELALSPRIACIDDLCNAPTVKDLGKHMSYHRRTS